MANGKDPFSWTQLLLLEGEGLKALIDPFLDGNPAASANRKNSMTSTPYFLHTDTVTTWAALLKSPKETMR